MEEQELITIREASRRLGVSDTAVHKAVKSGRVTVGPLNPKNGRPQMEWPKVRDQWLANSDTSKRSHVGSKGGAKRAEHYASGAEVKLPTADRMDEMPDIQAGAASAGAGPKSGRDGNYTQARAAREVYAAKLAKLDYEQKVGKLVDADEVKVVWFKHIAAAKTRIMGIPASCKSRYADLPLAAIAVIEQVCREALEDLANGGD